MSDNSQQAASKDAGTGKKIRKGPKLMGAMILTAAAIAGVCFGTYRIIDSVAYVGTDDASIDGRQVKLSSKIMARIKEVKVAEGDTVKAGQTLVIMEDRDLRAQETQALASLSYAKENMNLAKVNLDKAEGDYDRMKILFTAGGPARKITTTPRRRWKRPRPSASSPGPRWIPPPPRSA